MDLLQLNYFSQLHDDENVIFCKTDFLPNEFNRIASKGPVVLISGNSDYEINDNVVDHCPPNVIKWYAQNATCSSDRVEGIPIGIENTIACKREGHGKVWDHALEKPEILISTPRPEPTKDIYANFSVKTHWSREIVAYTINKIPYITKRTGLSYREFVSDVLDHRMVVCPVGNGIDTHRMWETLYLDRVPIVIRSPVSERFEELPIIFIDDWEELKNIEVIYDKYYNVLSNSKSMLDPQYWVDKIKGHLNEYFNHR